MKFIIVTVYLVQLVCAASTIRVSDFGDGSAALSNAQAAYNTASDGDTVLFPLRGNASWSAGLTVNKPITIDGNGTVLTSETSLNNGLIYITSLTNQNMVRVTGFTFNCTNLATGSALVVQNNVSLDKLRVDHNSFYFGNVQLIIGGAYGVVDHNYFYNGIKGIEFTAGSVWQANQSWEVMEPGRADCLFIEDNHFIQNSNYTLPYGQEQIGTFNGGKLVVRYNEFNADDWPLDVTAYAVGPHGSASGGATNGYWQCAYGLGTQARRSQAIIEQYNNYIHGKRMDYALNARGSSCLYWSNIIVTMRSDLQQILLREEEYTVETWIPNRTNWPAEDQVHNSFFWGNVATNNGVLQTTFTVNDYGMPWAIQENRDYFLHEPQSSGGKESFTGLNGASGSYPTDGLKFPTYGTMTFSSSGPNAYYPYSPYTYPHPLVTLLDSPQATSTTATIGTLRSAP